MKFYLLGSLTLLMSIAFCSCKNDSTKDSLASKSESINTDLQDQSQSTYQIDPSTIKIGWTAFKTTEKLAVKGVFKNLSKDNVMNIPQAPNMNMALDAIEFKIPIDSLDSGNPARDAIIKTFFFGKMLHTNNLSGSLHVNATKPSMGTMTLKMNDKMNNFPISISYNGNIVSIHGEMNLDAWNTTEAQASLHKNCEEKHTGKDGVSKTWNVVEIDGSVKIVQK